MKPPTVVIGALLWIGTLAGAYFLGSASGKHEAAEAVTLQADGSSGDVRFELPAVAASASVGRGTGSASTTSEVSLSGGDDLSAIVRKASNLLSGGGMMNISGFVEVGRLLEAIPVASMPDALAEVNALKNSQAKQGMMALLLSRWAEVDGPAALAYAEELGKAGNGGWMTGGAAKMAVLQTWGQKDPEAVWAWYQEHKDDEGGAGMMGGMGGSAMALTGVFSGMMTQDPAAAFARMEAINDKTAKGMALNAMLQHITDEEVRSEFGNYLDRLEEGERRSALTNIAGQWMMMDPDGMKEFAQSRSVEERSAMFRQAGQMMLGLQPEEGARLMLENASDAELPQTYSQIASALAMRDPKQAGEWLQQQPQGAELDQARNVFASSVAQQDPDSAMAWAKAITDSEMRTQAVTSVFMQWRRSDPAAAEAALPESGLSPEHVERLLQQIDNESGGDVGGTDHLQ